MSVVINGSGSLSGISVGGLNDGIVDEGTIANDAVTLAKMAGGTDGQILTYDASGNPSAVGPGSDGQVLTSTGAGSPPAFESVGYTLLGTNATTSGTSSILTGIPSGTIDTLVVLDKVSINGAAELQLCLGDAGGIETTGYASTTHRAGGTALTAVYDDTGHFMIIDGGHTTDAFSAVLHVTCASLAQLSFVTSWVAKGSTAATNFGSGTKSMSHGFTQMELKISSGAFDAGQWTVYYQ